MLAHSLAPHPRSSVSHTRARTTVGRRRRRVRTAPSASSRDSLLPYLLPPSSVFRLQAHVTKTGGCSARRTQAAAWIAPSRALSPTCAHLRVSAPPSSDLVTALCFVPSPAMAGDALRRRADASKESEPSSSISGFLWGRDLGFGLSRVRVPGSSVSRLKMSGSDRTSL